MISTLFAESYQHSSIIRCPNFQHLIDTYGCINWFRRRLCGKTQLTLVEENQPEALSLLRTPYPIKVEDNTLCAETPMRLVYNRILKNLLIVEMFSAAALKTLSLSLTLTKFTPVTTTSTMTSEFNALETNHLIQSMFQSRFKILKSQEQKPWGSKQQTLKRRKSNPLWGDISIQTPSDRFVVGDENELVYQHAFKRS